MDGRKDYVKTFGDTFFNSIKFNNLSDDFISVSPKNKGFLVDVPAYHVFTNKSFQGNRILQAVDKKDNYYFLKEVTLNDVDYIEEDAFELERIQERFCKNLELEYQKGIFTDDNRVFESNTVFKNTEKKIFLKTVTNGSHYYLLGCVSKNDISKNSFFNSFKITDFNYPTKSFERKIDTTLYFSVNTNVSPSFNRYNANVSKKDKKYKAYTKNTTYKNSANEKIFVELNKLNDLTSYDNVDSLWKSETNNFNRINNYLRLNANLSFNNLKLSSGLKKHNIEHGIDEKGHHFYTYYLKDSLSSKAIKIKKVLVKGAIYELKTLIDTDFSESKFVSTFYESFTPKDTVLGKSLFIDKTTQFFTALKAKDSLALDSYRFVNFKKKDVKSLITILGTYEFEENQLEIKEHLIEQLSRFKTKKVTRFLDDLYVRSFNNPRNQLAIVKSIIKEKSTVSYSRFLNLLALDIPLSSNSYEINSMINSVSDSLSIAKNLFPEILNYATIEEYKKPIYNLLVDVLNEDLLKSTNYVSYKKQILNQARIELKRQLGKKTNTNSYTKKTEGDLLNIYVQLLYPFRKDKNVKTFFDNIVYVKNADVKSTLVTLQIEASEKYDTSIFDDLTSELTSRGILYSKLHEINKTSFYPKKYNSKNEIYKAILFKSAVKPKLKDSIVFLDKRDFKISDKKFEAYFFKSKINKNSTKTYGKDWAMNYIIFENNGNEIMVNPILEKTNQNLDITKPIEEIINDLVEENRLKRRKRVNLNSNNYNNMGLF
jgi:hypothetical protein